MITSGESTSSRDSWRVGDLARMTGVTVRALHHYDALGLLTPSARSNAGHRLYTQVDVAALYRVLALRRLGFSLQQIRALLKDPAFSLRDVVERHRADTALRIQGLQRLNARLAGLDGALRAYGDEAPASSLLDILEDMTMLDTTTHGTTSLLVYDDIDAAQRYLSRVFALSPGRLVRDGDGRAVHAEVLAGDQLIWLHPAAEDYRSPRATGAVTGMTVVSVDDADAHCERARAAGATIVEEPVDQDYDVREYGARDPEGHLWFFHGPRP